MEKFFCDSKLILKNLKKHFFISLVLIISILSICLVWDKEMENSRNMIYVFGANKIKNVSKSIRKMEYKEGRNVAYGVDVSAWQGKIDWDKVANSGIEFAIIRCGYRETVGAEIKEDSLFKENIEGAIKAGLKVGVYFFGTAINSEEAMEEANFTLNLIKDYEITYPVVYDMEAFDKDRLLGVSYDIITDNMLLFSDIMRENGYVPMVYSYKIAFTDKLDTTRLNENLIWLAHFTDETTYDEKYDVWQYSRQGKVDGIDVDVDLNVSFLDM